MGKPHIVFGTRTPDADTAAAFGVAPSEISETWLEHVLDGDKWMVAARVIPDANGNAVVGELRIFPYEPNRPDGFRPEWSAVALGNRAPVPLGGLPGTLLRRTIRLSDYERTVRTAFGVLLGNSFAAGVPENSLAAGLPADHLVMVAVRRLQDDGYRTSAPSGSAVSPAGHKLGRKALPDLEYARLARDYAVAIEKEEHPIATVAQQWDQTPAWVTSRIARARRYGFLSKAGARGRRGGVLTEKARRVLNAKAEGSSELRKHKRNSTKEARHGKTPRSRRG